MIGRLLSARRWIAGKLLLELGPESVTYASYPVWIVCAVSSIFALLSVVSTGVHLAWAGFVAPAGVTAGLLAIHVTIRLGRRTPELETVSGVFAAICWSGLMALIATHAGLRANSPLIDDALARSDALLGFSAPWLIGAVSGHPRVTGLLDFIYYTVFLALFVAALAVSAGKFRQRGWDLAFSFAFGSTLCGMIATVYPAIGTYIHYRIAPDVIAGLPKGAGTFYLSVFESIRSGAVSTIDFDKMTGVVTFPSFHGAIAFMTAFALRGVPRLASFAWAWSALVNISAIPMGGHYGTDLVVGGLLWALSAWFMIAIAREKERRDLAPTPDLALQT
jgi:membrane-associated phospholipid phosphatase